MTENEFEAHNSCNIDQKIQLYLSEKVNNDRGNYSKEETSKCSAGYGVMLLDDFVTQYMAQNIVEKKYQNNPMYIGGIYKKHGKEKRSGFLEYNFCSNFNDYSIYEYLGRKFIEALYGREDVYRFCVESIDSKIVDNILASYRYRRGGMENIYKILTYLGTIKQNLTQNPQNIELIVNRLLKVLSYEVDRARLYSDEKNR